MSSSEQSIICRNCKEEFPTSTGNCPHCGTSIHDRSKLIVVGLFGIALMGGSLFKLSSLWVFGIFGLALAGLSGYLVYDQRQRLNEAETSGEGVFGTADES